ncbi:MAG TPA: hypothetical protein VK620_35035, partial [Bradyrhizobium sp.]|nr:hypothetical protein [Bradyrhizobium sp.]
IEDVGWVEPAKPIISINAMMGIAEFIIGRAFARPVGSIRATAADNKTGSSDLPVGQFVDRAVESFFRIFRKIFVAT